MKKNFNIVNIRQGKGFTILEILMVITLIGILIVITVPLAANIVNRAELNSAHESLYNSILRAQNLSKIQYRNQQWRVCIDNDNTAKQYVITAGSCASTLYPETIKFSSNITVSSTQTLDLAFTPKGELNYNGSFSRITLSSGGVSKSILVNKNGVIDKTSTSDPSSNISTPSIVTNGLVLHLDAGNPASYPGTGNTWTDLSGNNNNGTLMPAVGGPTYNSANGGSLSFDGVDDYISVSNTSQLRPSTELSVGMWIKANSITTGWVRLFGQDPYNGGPLIFLETGGSLIRALHYPNGDEVRCNTNYSISTTQYTYVVFTFKTGDAIRSYFNGLENITEALSAVTFSYNTSNPYLIGHSGGSWFNGNISNVSFYNRALTFEEIQQNFNATRGRFGL